MTNENKQRKQKIHICMCVRASKTSLNKLIFKAFSSCAKHCSFALPISSDNKRVKTFLCRTNNPTVSIAVDDWEKPLGTHTRSSSASTWGTMRNFARCARARACGKISERHLAAWHEKWNWTCSNRLIIGTTRTTLVYATLMIYMW